MCVSFLPGYRSSFKKKKIVLNTLDYRREGINEKHTTTKLKGYKMTLSLFMLSHLIIFVIGQLKKVQNQMDE